MAGMRAPRVRYPWQSVSLQIVARRYDDSNVIFYFFISICTLIIFPRFIYDPVGTPMTLSYACTLLEYCLVTGLDWLDILLSLRSSMIETLCERLDVSFNRQSQPTQQYHYVQFLCIKTSLYR